MPSSRASATPPTFVNICTGLGVNLPVLQPVGTTTDALLSAVLNPIIGTVNVNLQQALSGKAIGLGVLDPATNTFVSLPASQCNVAANSFSLSGTTGLSLGGGQITGLGSGTAASAGDPTAIAFGNGASTTTGLANAIAIGTNASASQAGAIALGSGSAALRGALASYTAFGLAGTQSSSGELSIGSSGAQRQITNVAPGQAGTDAVNVAQLSGAAGNLGTSLATVIGTGASYSATTGKVTGPSFTIQGGSYTTIASAFGAVDTALSGVSGGTTQAFVSNNNAAAALATASGANAAAGGYGASAQGTASLVLGNGASDNAVANSVVLGKGASIAANLVGSNIVIGRGSTAVQGAVTNYTPFGLLTTQTSVGELSIGSSGSARQITNLAAGQAGTDAVNVAQLSGAAANLGNSLATIVGTGAAYSGTTGAVTAAPFSIQGVHYGTIVAAFGAVDTALNSVSGGGGGGSGTPAFASDNTAAAGVAAAGGANATAGGYGASAQGAASLVLGNGASDGGNAKSVVLGNGAQVLATSGSNVVVGQGSTAARGAVSSYTPFGLLTPQSSAGEVSIGTSSAQRQITHLAAGQADTDAVNVAQLTGAASNLGTSLKTVIGAGAAYDAATGTVTAPSFTVGHSTYTTIGGALAALNTSVTAPVVQYSTPGAPTTPSPGVASNDVTLVGAATASAVALHNLASGRIAAGSTDGVNGGQLYAGSTSVAAILGGGATYDAATDVIANPNYVVQGTSYSTVGTALGALSSAITGSGTQKYFQANSSLGAASATAAGAVAIGPLAIASGASAVALGSGATALGSNSVAIGAGSTDNGLSNVVSVGAAGAERRITNVAAGTLSATSTDAVTGSQLYQTDAEVASLAHGAVRYATGPGGRTLSSIALASDQGGPVIIHNLAPGVAPDDAATVQQVRTASRNAVQYSVTDGVRSNIVALAGGSDGGVTIRNLAPGVAGSDAVNLAQMQSYSAASTTLANAYTDQKFNNLAAYTQAQVQRARADAAGGTSLALAAGGLRFDDGPGRTSIAGASAYYDGQMGIAFGLGHTSDDGRLRFNMSVTASPTMATTEIGAVMGLSFALR